METATMKTAADRAGKMQFWAIVEIMGRQRLAGFLQEVALGGAAMIRVDVPEVTYTEEKVNYTTGQRTATEVTIPSFTKFYGVPAIYAITPCDEETARAAVESFRERPVAEYSIREVKRLPAPMPVPPMVPYEDDDDPANELSAGEDEELDDEPMAVAADAPQSPGAMWQKVDREHPCPICGGDTWCLRSFDGLKARCYRIRKTETGPDPAPSAHGPEETLPEGPTLKCATVGCFERAKYAVWRTCDPEVRTILCPEHFDLFYYTHTAVAREPWLTGLSPDEVAALLADSERREREERAQASAPVPTAVDPDPAAAEAKRLDEEPF